MILALREAFIRGWDARQVHVPGVDDAIVTAEVFHEIRAGRPIPAIKLVRILTEGMTLGGCRVNA